MKLPIYLDYQATTPVDSRVLDEMLPYFRERFGNSSSKEHEFGWVAESAVEVARERVAQLIGSTPHEIVFTSGATESNNLAIRGVLESAAMTRRKHIVTSAIEHPSVMEVCRALQARGTCDVTYLTVDSGGLINLDHLKKSIRPETILVSIIFANNEVGTIQNIEEIARICRAHDVLFHTDATQAVGTLPVHVDALPVDLLSLSAHKIYGPKGVGALYVRRKNPRVAIHPQNYGGGHERGLRSGTLNVPGIVGLGKAAMIAHEEKQSESTRLRNLRDLLWQKLSQAIPELKLNGHPTQNLPHNLNVTFPEVDGEGLMLAVREVAVSSGSACGTGKTEPSAVLTAMGRTPEEISSSIRFSLGRLTTEEEIRYTATRYIDAYQKLHSFKFQLGDALTSSPLL